MSLEGETRLEKRIDQLEAKMDQSFAALESRIEKRIELGERMWDERFRDLKTDSDERFRDLKSDFDNRYRESKLDTNQRFDKIDRALEDIRASLTSVHIKATLSGATAGLAVSIASFAIFILARTGFKGIN